MRCENYMRGSLLNEVLAAGARPSDILISSDVDEIPKPEYLRPLRDCGIFTPLSVVKSAVVSHLWNHEQSPISEEKDT